MDEPELFKGRRKKRREPGEEHDIFGELDVDLDSDHPVHEEFVDDKRLREMKKKARLGRN